MSNKAVLLVLAISLLLAAGQAQNNSTSPEVPPIQPTQPQEPSVESIQLHHTYTYDLPPNIPTSWTITLPETIPDDNDLIVTVQSPPNEPLQQPSLTIKNANQSIQKCDAANNEFTGVCILDKTKLSPSSIITIIAECPFTCHLTLSAELEARLTIQVNRTLKIKAPLEFAREYEFQMQVPLDQQFTEMAIYAQIKDYSVAGGGLVLLANLGDKTRAIPTPNSYDQAGESIFWGGLALYYSKKDFTEANNWIKIYLSVSAGMEVNLFTKLTNGNDFSIQLENAYFDYTTDKEPKRYYLDLTKNSEKVAGKTILLGFIIYAGSPNIVVSLDQEMKTVLKGTETFGTVSYLLTNSLRSSDPNYNGTIYVTVSSTWNSNYYFYTAVHENNYITAQPDLAYYNQLNKDETFNYFLNDILYYNTSDPTATTKRNYAIKVDIFRGKGTFGVRRCRPVEEGRGQSACVINSTTDLLKDETALNDFKTLSVTIKTTENYYQILFEYDLSACQPVLSQSPEIKAYFCSFHAIGANSQEARLDYTWQITPRVYTSLMKENQLVRDSIFEEQLLFYRFSLSSLDDVEEVAFFITIIEGDAYLLGSTTDPYPNFSGGDSVKTSGNNRIIFGNKELANTFFISVFGLEYTAYSIGVVVKRKATFDNQTSTNTSVLPRQTKTALQLNLQQEYSFKEEDTSATFTILAFDDITAKIQIIEIVGNVKMEVKTSDGEKANCLPKALSSTSVACDLQMKKGQVYDVAVTGSQGSQQKFVIAYYKADNCVPYSLDMPLYKELAVGESGCIAFSVTKIVDLQLTTSIPISELIHNTLDMQLCINGNCLKLEDRHYKISKDMISSLCKLDSSKKESCPIIVNFTSSSSASLQFYIILEESSIDIALFDGISQRVQTDQLSTTQGKRFFFEVNSYSSIRVFFTSLTDDFYCILAHFVTQKDFNADSSTTYLDYRTKDKESENLSNFYRFYKSGSGATLFAIPQEDIEKYCKDCLFTLSVFSVYNSNHGFAAFEIEVSQQETVINIGESKIGYLEQDQIFVYQLQQPSASDGVISVRDLNKESSTQNNCFQISLEGVGYFAAEEVLVVKKQSKYLNLFITGIKPICSFEISYTSLTQPIIKVLQNQAYSFQIDQQGTAYFLYNHNYNLSFRAISINSNGYTTLAATPIDKKFTLKEQLSAAPTSFPFTADESSGQLMVLNNSPSFCYNCTYLLAVSSKKGAKGELFLSYFNSKVPLSIKGVIRQTINPSELSYRNYTFSSAVTFNISINIIYGSIVVTVISPSNVTVKSQKISKTTVLKIPYVSDKTGDFFQFQSFFDCYSINVVAEANASFTIGASKVDITKKLLQGVINYVSLQKEKDYILEFLNLQTNDKKTTEPDSLNVLIEIITRMESGISLPRIKIVASASAQNGGGSKPIRIISRNDSENSINIKLPLFKGDYYISVSSDQDVYVSVLLVKQSLVHLTPQSTAFMTKPGIFELYSPEKAVMIQIFPCYGDIEVEATDSFKDFSSSSKSVGQIALEQTNFGGHFVIGSESIYGLYFLRVGNKNPTSSDISYVLNYYFYDSGDILPYKLIDLSSPDISYSLKKDSITFNITPLMVKDLGESPIQSYKTQYKLYYSNTKNSISLFANCRLDSVFAQASGVISSNSVSFTLPTKELQELGDIFFVGAQAIVTLTVNSSAKTQHYPQQLNLIYNIIEISNPHSPSFQHESNFSVQTILLWMFLPFALAGLALYLSIRFCIKRYRGMVPDNLVEEAGESGEVANPDGGPKNSNASGTFKDDTD